MPSKEEKDTDRLLVDAARSGDIKVIRAALDAGANIDVEFWGKTPLMLAAERG